MAEGIDRSNYQAVYRPCRSPHPVSVPVTLREEEVARGPGEPPEAATPSLTNARNAFAMRAIARCLMLGVAAGGLAGCKNGTGTTGSSWNPFAKAKTPDPVISSVPPGPQLPSTAAAGMAPPFNPSSTAGATAQASALGAARPNGTAANGTVAGAYAGAPAASAYPERPASATAPYPNTGYPPQSLNFPAATAAPGATGNNLVQQGPYDATYPDAAAARSTRWAESPADPARNAASAAPQDNRFANAGMDSTGGYKTGSPYDAAPSAPAGGERQSRWSGGEASRGGGAQYDVAGAEPARGPAAEQPSAPPAEPARDGVRVAGRDEFRPGDTKYEPGKNGYNPPGAPAYGVPYKKNAAQGVYDRRDPFYRPGGTSDYIPADTRRANAAPAEGPAARTADGRSGAYERAQFDGRTSDLDRSPAADARSNIYDRPAYNDGTIGPTGSAPTTSAPRSGSWPGSGY